MEEARVRAGINERVERGTTGRSDRPKRVLIELNSLRLTKDE
jgi:hypothetical protein